MADEYKQIKDNFAAELAASSRNQKSSLSYIKNVLSEKPLVTNGIAQAMVLGGTNYTVALVGINDRKSTIIKSEKGKLPVFKSKVDFSEFINSHIDHNAEAMGLNFAFPLQPVSGPSNELDGILIRGTKEHAFDGLIGEQVGKVVRKLYFEKYKKQIPVTVANDSVCLTLAGASSEEGGMILGTGFNMSLKVTENGEKSVVNLEAGNFNGFKITDVLKSIDAESDTPGKMLFEKAIAGRYLADYFNEETKLLNLKLPPIKTSKDLSILAQTNRNTEGKLANGLLEKSAKMLASAIAGVYEFRNQPKRLEFITEGSLFFKGYKYQENVDKQLMALGVPKNAIKLKYIEDSSLKGTIGLLTN